jgi:hypothetical protein
MLKTLVWLGLLWAVSALAWQLLRAWGGGRREHGRRAGDSLLGVRYNFTRAMLPTHKETATRHWAEFVVGLALHAGVVSVSAALFLWLLWARAGDVAFDVVRPLAWLGLVAGLVLLVRRAVSPRLRQMSVPDDYLAAGGTCLFLATAGLFAGTSAQALFALCAVLVMIYLPLGKLRHAVFFYAARADLGRRLGYRGVYPPADPGAEPHHG